MREKARSGHIPILLFVILTFLLGCAALHPALVSAETTLTETSRITRYELTTGVIHTWGQQNASGQMVWQKGYGPGMDYPIRSSKSIGKGRENVKLYAYDPSLSIDWNQIKKPSSSGYSSPQKYAEKFMQNSGAPNGFSVDYNSATGSVKYSYEVTLLDGNKYNSKTHLTNNGFESLKEFVGGYIPPDQEAIIKNMGGGTGQGIEGWLWFVPVMLQYDEVTYEKVDLSAPKAILNLPVTANVGETYTASDGPSYIPPGGTLKRSVLEKKEEGASWQTVSGWNGTSADQTADREGVIQYRLTITLTNGQSDTDEKTIRIENQQQISGQARLSLPPYGYEGHSVLAEDESRFTVDGVSYSAQRAIAEGVAKDSFHIPDGSGSIRKQGTEATLKFPRKGTYPVTLNVEMKDGTLLSDVKEIEILKTPTVNASLTGTQKENRKQVLNVQVAKRPDQPITDLWIELEDLAGGGKVHLDAHMDGTPNQLQNSEEIKTRPVENLPSDEYFTNVKLEFLTKNKVTKQYKYRVFAKDQKGDTDQVEKEFTVVPDAPPEAKIQMEDQFLRTAGANDALAVVTDVSITDGDQLARTWRAAFAPNGVSPGAVQFQDEDFHSLDYEDLSFGSKKSIRFHKDGVGAFAVKLDVKDIWSDEETLPEYIIPDDYLTASAMKVSQVVNVAPVVSLEAKPTKAASVLLLAAGEEEYESCLNQKSKLEQALIEKGVDPHITIRQLSPKASSGWDFQEAGQTVSEAYGYEGRWTFLFNHGFCLDDANYYSVSATWTGSGVGAYPGYPYYITAYNVRSGDVKWRYTLNQSALKVDSGSDSTRLLQDQTGRYLFLRSGGKTLILSKDTGAYLTTLNCAVGDQTVVNNGGVIYDFKSDGVWRIDQSGRTSNLYPAHISGEAAPWEGQYVFIASSGNQAFKGVFDPDSEEITLYQLPGTQSDTPGHPYQLLTADADGRLIVEGAGYIRAYDAKNKLTGILSAPAKYTYRPVTDEHGRCDYIAYTYNNGDDVHWELRGFQGEYMTKMTKSNTSPGTNSDQIIMAKQIGSFVYIGTGGDWDWLPSQGDHYSENMFTTCRFDLRSGSGDVRRGGLGTDITTQNGAVSDAYAAFHTADNEAMPQVNAKGSYTRFITWAQSVDQLTSRAVERHLNRGASLRAVVLADNTNTARTDGTWALENQIKAADAKFLYASDFTYPQGYGARMVDDLNEVNAGSAVLLPNISNMMERVASELADEKGNKNDVLLVEPTGSSGTLSRTIPLKSGEKVYYEYEMKQENAAAATDILDPSYPVYYQGEDSSYKYIVTKQEREDFNAPDFTNPFFQFIPTGQRDYLPKRMQEGKYGINLNYLGRYKYGANLHDTGTIIFQTSSPAVVDFDFAYSRGNSTDYTGCMVFIDDKPWEQNTYPRKQSGHYMHKQILSPGQHRLKLQYFQDGVYNSSDCYMLIDNLAVSYVQTSGDSNDGSTSYGALLEEGGDWQMVSGVLSAPYPDYTRQTASHYSGTFSRSNGCLGIPRDPIETHHGIRTWFGQINIPSGEMAVTGKLNVHSTVDDAGGMPYVYFTVGEDEWTAGIVEGRHANHYVIPKGEQSIQLPVLTGSKPVKYDASPSYHGGAYATVRGADFWLVPESNAPVKSGHYFMNGSGMYALHKTYGGSCKITLHFNGAGSKYYLRNFRLFTIKGRRKVYLTDENMTEGLNRWSQSGVKTSVIKDRVKEPAEQDKIVYKKGDLVAYSVFYSDYEKDPSKMEYWKYTHTPFNDGPHPDASVIMNAGGSVVSMPGKILNKPIDRFWIDGKYTVEHWQEDNTARPLTPKGNPDYDKKSNVASLTFYVTGGGNAPWITHIKTQPNKLKEGDRYRIEVGVDDEEKDPLSLTTELYQGKKLIFRDERQNLSAVNGIYPTAITGIVPQPAEAGSYKVVCTVRDQTGVGVGKYEFIILSQGKITGMVSHTDEWDRNRKKYNLKKFATEYNQTVNFNSYKKQEAPRKRGTNVFWSGERFLLQAAVAGNPKQVTCQIVGTPYQVTMTNTHQKNSNKEWIYTGSIWNEDMINKWGRTAPKQLTFRFTADYSGTSKTHSASVIVDQWEDYWQLHRYF